MSKIMLLIVLIAGLSFAQENELKFGVRTGASLYDVYWEGKPPGIGKGFGTGATLNIPISSSLSFNPELNFYYRNLYNHEMDYGQLGKAKESMTELALGIPLMLQFMPSENAPFYLACGANLNISLSAKLKQEFMEKKESIKYKHRSPIDFGAALGLGYYITKRFALDLRGIADFTNISSKKNEPAPQTMPPLPPINPFERNKTWLFQYGAGLTYFY